MYLCIHICIPTKAQIVHHYNNHQLLHTPLLFLAILIIFTPTSHPHSYIFSQIREKSMMLLLLLPDSKALTRPPHTLARAAKARENPLLAAAASLQLSRASISSLPIYHHTHTHTLETKTQRRLFVLSPRAQLLTRARAREMDFRGGIPALLRSSSAACRRGVAPKYHANARGRESRAKSIHSFGHPENMERASTDSYYLRPNFTVSRVCQRG